MQIGFQEVNEGKQKCGKSIQKMDKWYYRISMLLILIFAAIFLGMAVYYSVKALQGQEDWKKAQDSFSVFFAVAASVAAVKCLDLFLTYRQKKYERFSPEMMQKKLPPEDKRTLHEVLAFLSGKVMLLLWDILYTILVMAPVMVAAFLQASVVSWEWIFRPLIVFGIFICGHALCRIYYKKRSFRKKLLVATKMYIPILDDTLFCDRLEQSLKTTMRFYSRQLVVTDEFLLGYTRDDQFFEPAAIPREEILEAEFYLMRWAGHVRVTKGILACKLKNGFIVEFYTTRNEGITMVQKALDYCKVPYRYNANLKYDGGYYG